MGENDVELGVTCEAVIRESTRITPVQADEVRQIILRVSVPSFRFVEGQSIGVVIPGPHDFGNRYHMRRYSIANAHIAGRGEAVDVTLLVRRCFYIDEISGERYPGIASNYLCDAAPGERITISGPYRSPFVMPEDTKANLLMVGTGTGIAPFRAFIQHIYDQRGGWEGQVRLFYGAKSGMELLYMNDQNSDLAHYYDEQTFKAYQGLAGRPLMGAEQALARSLSENAEEVWTLLQQPNTHLFLAGLKSCATALDKAMAQAAGSAEAWQSIRLQMQEQGRWGEQLYS